MSSHHWRSKNVRETLLAFGEFRYFLAQEQTEMMLDFD
jgi:hypothetical protein